LTVEEQVKNLEIIAKELSRISRNLYHLLLTLSKNFLRILNIDYITINHLQEFSMVKFHNTLKNLETISKVVEV